MLKEKSMPRVELEINVKPSSIEKTLWKVVWKRKGRI